MFGKDEFHCVACRVTPAPQDQEWQVPRRPIRSCWRLDSVTREELCPYWRSRRISVSCRRRGSGLSVQEGEAREGRGLQVQVSGASGGGAGSVVQRKKQRLFPRRRQRHIATPAIAVGRSLAAEKDCQKWSATTRVAPPVTSNAMAPQKATTGRNSLGKSLPAARAGSVRQVDRRLFFRAGRSAGIVLQCCCASPCHGKSVHSLFGVPVAGLFR